MTIIIVEGRDLQLAVGAQLTFRRDFLVPATLQHGTAIPPKHSGEGIELIECGGQNATGVALIRLEGCRCSWFLGEDQSGAPVIRNSRIEFQARAQGSRSLRHPYHYVFAAVAQNGAVAEGQCSTLFHPDAPKRRPVRSED